jgi:dTDP-4-dehydrorhamnose reductase
VNNFHIVVTGANGQVGKSIQTLSIDLPTIRFTFLTKEELSINDKDAVYAFLQFHKPDALINCAAYTAVDAAETAHALALDVNAHAVEILASCCKTFDIKFIHISTDYVFDGLATIPYKETDQTNPVNFYGFSKLEGEKRAISINPKTVVVRTSWVYAPVGKNFVKTMLKLMQERSELNVVGDQWGSPTYAPDLANALISIAVADQLIPGIYHFSNDGIITWYDFAKAIAEISVASCNVHNITTAQYPTPAKRPFYSGLDKSKLQAVYGITLHPWRESLQTCIAQIR